MALVLLLAHHALPFDRLDEPRLLAAGETLLGAHTRMWVEI